MKQNTFNSTVNKNRWNSIAIEVDEKGNLQPYLMAPVDKILNHLLTRRDMEAHRRKANMALYVQSGSDSRCPSNSWGKGGGTWGDQPSTSGQRHTYSNHKAAKHAESAGAAESSWTQPDKLQQQGGDSRTRSRTRDSDAWGGWKGKDSDSQAHCILSDTSSWGGYTSLSRRPHKRR